MSIDDDELQLPQIASAAIPQIRVASYGGPNAIDEDERLLRLSRQLSDLDQNSWSSLLRIHQEKERPRNQHELRDATSISSSTPQGFTFVSINTKTGKRDWAAETQIRSHAAKRDQRRRRLEKKTQGEQTTPKTLTGKEHLKKHTLPETIHPFGQGVFDPFTSGHLLMSHRMQELIHFWVCLHQPTTNPLIYGGDNLSPFTVYRDLYSAKEDGAACHAMAALAGFAQAALQGSSSSCHDSVSLAKLHAEEASVYLGKAVRKLNTRFRHGTEALDHKTILTVARLVVAAAFANDIPALDIHYEGMIKLINLRGGIDTIPRDYANHSSRIDSNAAWTRMTRPRLPMYYSPYRNASPRAATCFKTRLLKDFLWPSLFDVACDLQAINQVLDLRLTMRKDEGLPLNTVAWVEDTFASTQHTLADFPHPQHLEAPSPPYYRQNCFRCAAYIYHNIVIRPRSAGGVIKRAVSRLMESIPLSEIWDCWARYSGVLLWVLCMGALGASHAQEISFFTKQFRRVIVESRVKSFDEILGIMRSQIWRDTIMENHLRTLTNECSYFVEDQTLC